MNLSLKFKLPLVCMLLYSGLANAYGDTKVASKLEKVIVFLNGAQVTRTASVTVTPGVNTITFESLSPDIDAQSIQVHADGAFTILSVKSELNFLNTQAKAKQITELQAQQKTIQDKIMLQNSLLDIYRQEEEMLGKNQVVSGQNTGLDILKLKAALDFQTERLTGLKKKEQDVKNQVAAYNAELQKYNRQIADITRGDSKTTTDIIVTVSSKITVLSPFMLSYLVHSAGWYPSYDVRAKDVKSPINITYKANVSQKCGEDWKVVKLTLSTANPSVSGSKPELRPCFLNFGMVYAGQDNNITKVSGRVTSRDDGQGMPGVSVMVKGTSIGTTTGINGEYSIQVPAGNPTLQFRFIGYETQERKATLANINVSMVASQNQLNEVAVVGYGTQFKKASLGSVSYDKTESQARASTKPVEVEQTENQTNFEFDIANPYDIPSDGKQYGVEIGQFSLAASFQYYVAPKLNTDVFLTAMLTDWNKYNFLSGEANLFFEGTFIGKSLLDTHSSGDTLNLSLGTDKNIIVTRTLQKASTQRQVIGSNKRETKDWQIDIKNRKNQPVNLLVEDQVPISQNTGIEVEKQELSAGKLTEADGKVQWTLTVAPSEEKKLELRYQVKYPKNQTVIVQ